MASDDETFENILEQVNDIIKTNNQQMKALSLLMGKINKIHNQEIKTCKKPPRFSIGTPAIVPTELLNFFDLSKNKKMARTEIMKQIYAYIEANNLKDKKNKKLIHPDKKLKKLFKITEDDNELTIETLPKFLSRCYGKNTPTSDSTSDSADEDE